MKRSPPDRLDLGRAIRELRGLHGWSQEELAHRAGIHWTYVGGIERGERNPGWDNIVKLAYALEGTVTSLAARAERIHGEDAANLE